MVRPRGEEQCLPKEDATSKQDADAPDSILRGRYDPTLPDPGVAGSLERRSGVPLRCAPWHRSPSYDLRRAPYDHPDFTNNALHENLFRDSLNVSFTATLASGHLRYANKFYWQFCRQHVQHP